MQLIDLLTNVSSTEPSLKIIARPIEGAFFPLSEARLIATEEPIPKGWGFFCAQEEASRSVLARWSDKAEKASGLIKQINRLLPERATASIYVNSSSAINIKMGETEFRWEKQNIQDYYDQSWMYRTLQQIIRWYPYAELDPAVLASAKEVADAATQAREEDLRQDENRREKLREQARATGLPVVLDSAEYDTLAAHGTNYLIFEPRTEREELYQRGISKSSMGDKIGFTGGQRELEAVIEYQSRIYQ